MGSNRALLLQSIHSRFRRALLTDHGWLRRLPLMHLRDRIDGHYDVVAGSLWMMYRGPLGLVFQVDDEVFHVDGTIALEWSGAGAKRRLQIRRDGRLLASYACPEPRPTLLAATLRLTPFVEEEDFDLARLVFDVAHDPGRRERVYR